MIVLDLYCGAGGAATGYARRGHAVIGVDIRKWPSFPYEFAQLDAIAFLRHLIEGGRWRLGSGRLLTLADIGFIHASPPCQLYTAGNRANITNHPDLVDATRDILEESGKPYVIENVPGAPLRDPIELCGRMFGLGAVDTDGEWLQLDRHRLFETNWELNSPPTCRPHDRSIQVGGVYGGARRNKYDARHIRRGGYVPPELTVLQALLDIDWMDEKELFLAIPPKYTEYIIEQYERLQIIVAEHAGNLFEVMR